MRNKRSRTSAPPAVAPLQEPETLPTPPSPPPRSDAQGSGVSPPRAALRVRSGILSRRLLGENTLTPPAWWQQQVTGYLLALPLVAGGVAGALHFQRFPSASLLIGVFVAALLWGAGPALFATAVGTLALDHYLLALPTHQLSFTWDSPEQLIPVIVACLLVSLLTAQREQGRRRARTAEHLSTRQAEALAAAHQLKDQFLSLASHELKTPIAAIKGYAQLTQRRLDNVLHTVPAIGTAQESLAKILQQSDRLTALVDDLLDVSRIQAGKLDLRLAVCDLVALCQQAAEEQYTSTERPIDLALPSEPVLLLADSERIGQVLHNLIGNALKYSDPQTRVQVTLTCQNGQAEVRVQDQGVGIPSDEVSMIFARFFSRPDGPRGSPARTGAGAGDLQRGDRAPWGAHLGGVRRGERQHGGVCAPAGGRDHG